LDTTKPEAKPPIPSDEVSAALLDLAAQGDLAALAARFLELVKGWAGPTAILAAAEDARSDSGWRLVPALCAGTGPLGAERAIARLVAEAPDCRRRPLLVKPAEETAGVRVRDNWIVPWSHEGEKGVLVLRGVAPGGPPNVGDAVLAAAGQLWPRLLGSPADRVQALIKDLEGAAGRLRDEAARQLERVEQARQLPSGERAELEAQLAAAHEQVQTGVKAHESSRARIAELEASVREAEERRQQAEGQRDATRAEIEKLASRVENLLAEQKEDGAQIEELKRSAAAGQAADASLRDAEQQRDQARAELERLAARVAELERDLAAATGRESEDGAARLRDAEAQRDQARADVERLTARVAEVEREATAAAERARAAEESAAALRAEAASPPAAAAAAPSPDSVHAALRRAAFVSEPLRTALRQVSGTPDAPRAAPWLSVVLLDREAPAPVALADALEAAGVRVRLAREPEELGLLLRDPAAADLEVAICDIAAFRPDQNAAGLIRTWEKDKPGLEFYISRGADPAEVDKARRVPQSLLAGHVPRPIQAAALLETLQILARKLGKR
jgi:hypothetical protein